MYRKWNAGTSNTEGIGSLKETAYLPHKPEHNCSIRPTTGKETFVNRMPSKSYKNQLDIKSMNKNQ